ncbi:hypothetical protein [Zhongshania borealis]|uniref:Uncharacterized protein n=1 Tax=Zhongshania borealis TaxID=889488 RepID=A0ABP7WEH3_9GAMM
MQTVMNPVNRDAKQATTSPLSDKLAIYIGEIQRLQTQVHYWRGRLAKAEEFTNHRRGDEDADVYYWQGNGHDNVKDMANGLAIVISASELRTALAAAGRIPDALQHKLTSMSQAVHFYAAQAKYSGSWTVGDNTHVMEDRGRIARNALEFSAKGMQS